LLQREGVWAGEYVSEDVVLGHAAWVARRGGSESPEVVVNMPQNALQLSSHSDLPNLPSWTDCLFPPGPEPRGSVGLRSPIGTCDQWR
jgi:hypothetical protein